MAKCCTKLELIEYEYEWKISQFSMVLKCAEKTVTLQSSPFSVGGGNHDTWYIIMELYGRETFAHDSFRVYLYRNSVNNLSVRVFQKYSLNAEREKINFSNRDDIHEFPPGNSVSGFSGCYKVDRLLENAEKYLPNDELTIICELTIIGDMTTTSVERCHVPDITINNFTEDLAMLLNNNKFSDVTFQIYGKKIQAHKAILAVRSSVFSAMFQHPMKEQNSNIVTIEDIQPEIFEKMLEYIYTNNVTDIDRTAMDLLFVADKYNLNGLKQLCEKSLSENITVDNVVEMYVLADRHNVAKLIEYVQHFMATNLVDIIKTPAYEVMEKEYSQLIATFLRKLPMMKLCYNEDHEDK